jgi:CRISPR-associated endonuclease/helicase Cas3
MITSAALWAKLDRNDHNTIQAWHSLIHHSADVAAVLLALLDQPMIASRLSTLAGTGSLCPVTRMRLGALAFLHDIGKANRGFRARVAPDSQNVGHIDELAWLFGAGQSLHPHLSAVLGLNRIESWFADDNWDLFEAVFAHHGRPWNRRAPDARRHWVATKAGDPIADLVPMRAALDIWFAEAFGPGPELPSAPGFHHAFAGLLMLADWLGSDTQFFPFANGEGGDRMAFAKARAVDALSAVGLIVEPGREAVRQAGLDFTRQFGIAFPHLLQELAIVPAARLLVMEAETGSGKTEAALWRFAHLFAQGQVDGVYFALPTRVAATQMFGRLRRFRDGLFGPDGPIVVRAVPGQIGADAAEGRRLPDFGFEWSDDPDGGLRRTRWAAEHPKRFLAAQMAVGTIDQVLLGVLAVKHAHLRGSTLMRHLLVVDEVHASDTYMAGLLDAVLQAHLAAGGHALLLSATLGGAARSRLLRTPIPSLKEAEAAPYPALSWSEAGDEVRLNVPARQSTGKQVRVAVQGLLDNPAAIATQALNAARLGARVLVIRNTVAGAVAVQRALDQTAGPDAAMLFRVAGVATLHHGRFAPSDRRLLDGAVEATMGKIRPSGGVVVVGTQTLEQSLDLDADLLLTDLCPVDVLLQRIGRLHRHARDRPSGFETPVAIVLTPTDRDLLPLARRGRHGLGAHVYDDLRMIEVTWRLIEAHATWSIPAMNRMLVERVTHPEILDGLTAELLALDAAWGPHLSKVEGTDRQHAMEAAYAVFDRNAPFSEFQVSDERRVTRLGAADRQIAFDVPPPGPFGVPVTTLRLPWHWVETVAVEALPSAVTWTTDGLHFSLGQAEFSYGRLGLVRR